MKNNGGACLNSPMVRPVGNGKVPAIANNTIGTTGVPSTQPAQIRFIGTARIPPSAGADRVPTYPKERY
jgi:hypothetical protein